MSPENGEGRRAAGPDVQLADTGTSVTRRRIHRVAIRRAHWAPSTPSRSRYFMSAYDADAATRDLAAAGWVVTRTVSDVTVEFLPWSP